MANIPMISTKPTSWVIFREYGILNQWKTAPTLSAEELSLGQHAAVIIETKYHTALHHTPLVHNPDITSYSFFSKLT